MYKYGCTSWSTVFALILYRLCTAGIHSSKSPVKFSQQPTPHTNSMFLGKPHLVQKWNLLIFIKIGRTIIFIGINITVVSTKHSSISMSHALISVLIICSRETATKIHLHILNRSEIYTSKIKFRSMMWVNSSFSSSTGFKQNISTLNLKSVFLSTTYSLMHWGIWIWVFFCTIWWSVTSRNSTHCHFRVSFPLWPFHSDKLHVVIFIEAKRHFLSHLCCNTHLQCTKMGEKYIKYHLQI